jgi:S1-C subfamily serine protease
MKRVVTKPLISRTLAIGSAAVLAGTALALNAPEQTQKESKPPALKLNLDQAAVNRAGTLNNSFYPIVQKVAPSVVKISVSLTAPKQLMSGPDLDFFSSLLRRERL